MNTRAQAVFFWLFAFVYRRDHKEVWTGWRWANITANRCKEFALLMGPNLLAGCLEEWQLQLIAFFASRLGEIEVRACVAGGAARRSLTAHAAQVATHSSIMQLIFLVFSFMVCAFALVRARCRGCQTLPVAQFGTSTAVNVRVSHHLASGRPRHVRHFDIADTGFNAAEPRQAKQVTVVALVYMALPLAVLLAAFFAGMRGNLGRIFSSDPRVRSARTGGHHRARDGAT
jgi:Na+-driven multidrug efflux pump